MSLVAARAKSVYAHCQFDQTGLDRKSARLRFLELPRFGTVHRLVRYTGWYGTQAGTVHRLVRYTGWSRSNARPARDIRETEENAF